MNNPVDKQGASSPIFIVGAPRSGTTLLLYMLRSHPRVFFPDEESHFIVPMHKLSDRYDRFRTRDDVKRALVDMHTIRPVFFRGYVQLSEMDTDALADDIFAAGCRSVADVIGHVYSTMAALAGKVRWGDKTPYYALHLPLIKKMFPSAKIVNVIRDGRDVALSLLARKHDMDTYNVYFAAKYWDQYVSTVKSASVKFDTGSLLDIRYEDLLDQPEATLRSICGFLGEEYLPTLIEFEKPKALDTDLLRKTPLIGQPLNTTNQGKWKAKMSPRQIATFERVAGTTLISNGYESSCETHLLPMPLRIYYRLHNKLLTLYNRQVRNPFPGEIKAFRRSIG